MKNSKYVYLLILVLVIGIILYFYLSNSNNNIDNSQANTQAFNSNSSTNTNPDTNTNENLNANLETSNMLKEDSTVKESTISSFATEIKDNSPGRLTNIRITCDIINGTILEPGQTFSFNEIVGQPSAGRGYQEATVIIDGEHETGIGGGNCQVSSTLYNAVLSTQNLAVIERHEHGGSGVTYVPAGKDAAVSYGSNMDLKFRNDNNYKIKINMSTDDKNIFATIVKIDK